MVPIIETLKKETTVIDFNYFHARPRFKNSIKQNILKENISHRFINLLTSRIVLKLNKHPYTTFYFMQIFNKTGF